MPEHMKPMQKGGATPKKQNKTQKGGNKSMEDAMKHSIKAAMKNPMHKGGAKSKKSKKSSMPSGMAYCLRCQKRVKVNSAEMKMIKMKTGKSRKFKVMQCACGHEVKNFSS